MINLIFKTLVRDIRLSFVLGSGLFNKILIFCYSMWLPLKRRVSPGAHFRREIKLKKFNKEFSFVLQDSVDLAVIGEVFLDEEYKFNSVGNPSVIFDLGGNTGLSVIYFKLRYPDSKVHVFEPDPSNILRIRENTKQFSNVYIYDVAVADEDGVKKFYIHPESSIASSMIKRTEDQKPMNVKSKTLDSLMEKLSVDRIDLLKFDIEGGELEVFHNFNGLEKISNIVGELHLDLIDATEEDFLKIFESFNIETEKISDNRLIVRMYRK